MNSGLNDDDEDRGLELALVPVGQGKFRALLGDLSITRPTRQPLFDGARSMLALGYPATTVVRVRHKGTIAMSGEVGELARWSVEERDRGGLRKVLWKPRENAVSSDGGAPPAADEASEVERRSRARRSLATNGWRRPLSMVAHTQLGHVSGRDPSHRNDGENALRVAHSSTTTGFFVSESEIGVNY